MNFKRYHASKNLADTLMGGINAIDGSDVPYNPTQSPICSQYIPCIQETNYVISSTQYPVQNYVAFYDTNKNYLSRTTGMPLTQERGFTTPANATYMRATFIHVTDGQLYPYSDGVHIMLNTGSTPLPYEPYSSEVWHDTPQYIHNTSTDTITTLPAVIYPTDSTATVELKGNTTQNGTPTTENPIIPQGVGERTENLYDKSAKNTNNGYISDGFLYSDGSEGVNGAYRVSEYITITPNQAYTLQYASSLNVPSICFYDSSKNFISGIAYNGKMVVSFTTPQNATYLRFSFMGRDEDKPMMLNTGSVALPYEPYGYKIPISSASTTTPVYLGEVQTVRRIKKLVLTGEEKYIKDGGGEYLYYIYKAVHMYHTYCFCSHLVHTKDYPKYEVGCFTYDNASVIYLNFGGDVMDEQPSGNTVAGLKEYIIAQYTAGTPVTIWYVLETEETGIVNEPLMKIGDYADEVSDITIPTIVGKNTFDVETTLKPSEASINYTGWHDTDVKEYISDTSIADWEK